MLARVAVGASAGLGPKIRRAASSPWTLARRLIPRGGPSLLRGRRRPHPGAGEWAVASRRGGRCLRCMMHVLPLPRHFGRKNGPSKKQCACIVTRHERRLLDYSTTSHEVGRVQKSRISQQPNCPSKTVLFERSWQIQNASAKSRLIPSQNTFLISASQKARVRLSFERVHGD
jgi:hypothetical protein